MLNTNPPDSNSPQYDPFFLRARRETCVILVIWAVFFAWVVGFSTAHGYEVNPETMKTVLGMPWWTFWGVAFPWFLATVLTLWLCFFYLKDGDMESPAGE